MDSIVYTQTLDTTERGQGPLPHLEVLLRYPLSPGLDKGFMVP